MIMPRVEALAKELGPLGVTWSCNAKANVPRKTLEVMKDNGLRLLLVGYESGNQKILHNIKKGVLVEVARRFSKDCHELGIVMHGTFILGCRVRPRRRSRRRSVRQGREPAHHPGIAGCALSGHFPATSRRRRTTGSPHEDEELLTDEGTQIAPLNYPHLGHTEIFDGVEAFYRGSISARRKSPPS